MNCDKLSAENVFSSLIISNRQITILLAKVKGALEFITSWSRTFIEFSEVSKVKESDK